MNARHFGYMLYRAAPASCLALVKNASPGLCPPTAGHVEVDGPECRLLEPGAGAASSLPVRDNACMDGADTGFLARTEDALAHYPPGEQIALHVSHYHDLLLRACIGDSGIRLGGQTAKLQEVFRRG